MLFCSQTDSIAQRPESACEKGNSYYRAKNYTAAIEEYTKAIAIDASYAPAYLGRAEACFMTRDFEKAATDMNKCLELNSGNTSARVRYAQLLFLVGKYQESLNEIVALEAAGVKNVTLKRIKGYDQVELKDPAGAKTTLDAYFAEQGPEKVIAGDWEYYGKALVGLGQDSLGAENMLKAGRLDRTKDYNFVEASKAFSKAKAYDKAIAAMKEKIAGGKPETNDYYYLGDAANKGKRWMTADSAWATYIERNPNAYQGYKFRARAQNGKDTLETKTFAAKAYYEQMLVKMKPEEKENYRADLEEALNYMGIYYLYSIDARDLPKARCYFEQVKYLNAGTSITKQALVLLMTKDLKDVVPIGCDSVRLGPQVVTVRESTPHSARSSHSNPPGEKAAVTNPPATKGPGSKPLVVYLQRSPSGVWLLDVGVNGQIIKDVVFDTGASTVSLSATEALFLLKQGYIRESDFTGTTTFQTADGNLSEGATLNIRELQLGGVMLYNVPASVSYSLDAPVLLGQSALQRFSRFQFDNERGALILE